MPPKKAKQSFYAVAIGDSPGIYSTWDECKGQVSGYPGAIYKKFDSQADAVQFYNANASIPLVVQPQSQPQSQPPPSQIPPPTKLRPQHSSFGIQSQHQSSSQAVPPSPRKTKAQSAGPAPYSLFADFDDQVNDIFEQHAQEIHKYRGLDVTNASKTSTIQPPNFDDHSTDIVAIPASERKNKYTGLYSRKKAESVPQTTSTTSTTSATQPISQTQQLFTSLYSRQRDRNYTSPIIPTPLTSAFSDLPHILPTIPAPLTIPHDIDIQDISTPTKAKRGPRASRSPKAGNSADDSGSSPKTKGRTAKKTAQQKREEKQEEPAQPLPSLPYVPVHELHGVTQYEHIISTLKSSHDTIIVHVDGSAAPSNPGPCGSGLVIEFPHGSDDKFSEYKYSISFGYGTNNYAELMAIRHACLLIPALMTKLAKKSEFKGRPQPWNKLAVFSDSNWALKTFLGQYKTVAPLYTEVPAVKALVPHYSQFLPKVRALGLTTLAAFWVKGHIGCGGNETVDGLAKLGSERSIARFPDWRRASPQPTDSYARDYEGEVTCYKTKKE